MARINVEDPWWTDPRRFQLGEKLGDIRLADGLMLQMWKLAQEFWARRQKIPLCVFNQIKDHEALFDVDLAYRRGKLIYVRGTRQFLEWYAERIANSSKGGKSKGIKAKETDSKRIANACPPAPAPAPAPDLNKKQKTYPEDFNKIYATYPRKEGKGDGFTVYKKLSREEKEKLPLAIERYKKAKAGTDPKYLMYFSTFMNEWVDWLDEDAGKTESLKPNNSEAIKKNEEAVRAIYAR